MTQQLINDPAYAQGQIQVLASMAIAIAQFLPQEEFLKFFATNLENLRATLLSSAVPESTLIGMDSMEQRILNTLKASTPV